MYSIIYSLSDSTSCFIIRDHASASRIDASYLKEWRYTLRSNSFLASILDPTWLGVYINISSLI